MVSTFAYPFGKFIDGVFSDFVIIHHEYANTLIRNVLKFVKVVLVDLVILVNESNENYI
jgi:hypothetical protein